MAESGHCLAGHISSNREWAKHDIGIASGWKHDIYEKHYPGGYELVWLDNPTDSEDFNLAVKRNTALGEEGEIPERERPGVTITYAEGMESMETNGIKLKNGHIGCPKCKGDQFTFSMHIDGTTFYQDSYACSNCKEPVWVTRQRSKESLAYWADED